MDGGGGGGSVCIPVLVFFAPEPLSVDATNDDCSVEVDNADSSSIWRPAYISHVALVAVVDHLFELVKGWMLDVMVWVGVCFTHWS